MSSVNDQTPPDWKQVEDLFQQAIDLPPDQRQAFLDSACQPGSWTHAEVNSLVASHEKMGTLEVPDMIADNVGESLQQLVQQIQEDTIEPALHASESEAELLGRIRDQLGVLKPDFEVVDVISQGATGIVLRVHQHSLSRDVAVKVLLASSDQPMRKRFVRESKATAKIRHENVVDIYSVEDHDALTFLVMELIDGPSLKQLIADAGQLEPRQAASIAGQLAAGLQAAHDKGLIHRDVKPANVILQSTSNPAKPDKARLIDFGIVRDLDGDQHTLDQMVVGTPAYMSPEQLFSPDQADSRSDVYGLGITLYEMLTGTRPYRGAPHMIMRQIESADAVSPRKLDDRIPRDLESICLKAIQHLPAKRYDSANEMREDLVRFLSGEATLARPVPRSEKVIRWCRRNHRLATALAMAALFAICLVFGALYFAFTVDSMNRALTREQNRTEASRVAAVLDAGPGALRSSLESLGTIDQAVSQKLQQALISPENGLNRKLNAALSLASAGQAQTEFLIQSLDQIYVSPESCSNLIDAFRSDPDACPRLRESVGDCVTDEQQAKRIVVLAFLGDLKLWNQAATNLKDPGLATAVVHLFPQWHGRLGNLLRLIDGENDLAADAKNLSLKLAYRAIAQLDSRSLTQSTVERLQAALSRASVDESYGTYHFRQLALRNILHAIDPDADIALAWDSSRCRNYGDFHLVEIEPATTRLGKFDPAKRSTDHPPRQVTLNRKYWIQDTEVSLSQFEPFVLEELGYASLDEWKQASGFSDEISPTKHHPVQAVSWFQAVQFCNWLSRKHGLSEAYRLLDDRYTEKLDDGSTRELPQYELDLDAGGFRLPTEAEWEFAARNHSQTLYFFGNDESYFSEYGIGSSLRLIEARPVRSLLPNSRGLYGVLGGVWEWTHDRYENQDDSPLVDPFGPPIYSEGAIGHVYQGGGVNTTSGGIDSESRGYSHPNSQFSNLGFRVAL